MPLQGALRRKQAAKTRALGSRMPGGCPSSVQSPRGTAAPERPGLRCQPTPSKLLWISAGVAPLPVPCDDMQKGTEGNLSSPVERVGSHKAWKGPGATRHLQHSALRPRLGPRERLQGRCRRGERRSGETQTTLRGPPGRHSGQRSRSAGQPRTWRRPGGRGWGNGTQVPSERASCPRCMPWSWRKGHVL
jgi:hypothetical protein